MAEKTAAAILHDLAKKAGTRPLFECVAQTGSQGLSSFECHCEAFGLKSTGVALSKKTAKQESAQALLFKMSWAGHCVPAPFCLPGALRPVVQNMFGTNSEAEKNGARGKKRVNTTIANEEPKKLNKQAFVKSREDGPSQGDKDGLGIVQEPTAGCSKNVAVNIGTEPEIITQRDYMEELSQVICVAVRQLGEYMFSTKFGRLVLLVRKWQPKLMNIQTSCELCGLKYELDCDAVTNVYTMKIEGKLVARATGAMKKLAKDAVENLAWEVLINEAISILVMERVIPQNDAHTRSPEIQGFWQPQPRADEFGAAVEPIMAARIMSMMGAGLGADAQGIADPETPQLQIINRASLCSVHAGLHQIKKAVEAVMTRFIASGSIDEDLVFSSDFSGLERKAISKAAAKEKNHLVCRSYGKNNERFMIVTKKINVFDLAKHVVINGGTTAKYKIFVPAKVTSFYRERE